MTFEANDSCTGCGRCAKDCPMGVLALEKGRPAVRPARAALCMNCQHCLAVCPPGAITLNGVGADACPDLDAMPIPPPNELANLLRTRRSVRQFAPADVPRADAEELLETLKYVPTGCNVRHLVFRVVGKAAEHDAFRTRLMNLLAERFEALPESLRRVVLGWQKDPKADVFFRGAPHVLVIYGDPQAVTPQADCVAAAAYFDLLAQAHGFGVTWFGFLSHIVAAVPEAADLFGIPRGAPFQAMLFGEPAVDYARGVNRSDGARIEWA